jgi:hypothetical protein
MRQFHRTIAAFAVALLGAITYSQFTYAAQLLTVIDDFDHPVANATIMLGFEPGNPFPGNVFTTDANGVAGIPADWKAALPLTVQAPGYITNTIPVAQPGVQTLRLHQQEPRNDFEVKGTSTDYGRLITDGKVDFGLVIPALNRSQMLAFDVSTLISPRSDTISIIGNDVQIPSNITLPQQTENYIFPIQFNKPDYRVYLRSPGRYKIGITHGQFPLQRVVGDIRAGKSFLEVVNYFDFKEGGQKVVDVSGNLDAIDLPVNQTPFNSSFAVKAPALGANQAMLALGLIQQDDIYLPTDLKRFTAGQSLNLKTNAAAGAPSVLAILMENPAKKLDLMTAALRAWFAPLLNVIDDLPGTRGAAQDFSKLSFAFLPAAGGVNPQFLPLINKPSLDGQIMRFQVPAVINGLAPAAMYLTLSEIETLGDGEMKIERRTRLWELWSDAWLSQIELPKLPITRQPDRTYRWDVLFLARPSGFMTSPDSGHDLNTITHATRNSLDI